MIEEIELSVLKRSEVSLLFPSIFVFSDSATSRESPMIPLIPSLRKMVFAFPYPNWRILLRLFIVGNPVIEPSLYLISTPS